jgi:formate hydrogenlyase subunit 3/multisubunit Na+/H+ antiporter MnhD subunit
VAVVKSGVFGIARVVLEVFGPELTGDLGAALPLAAAAAFTLVVASVIALRQDNLKRRLAFSTVSQLSYIVLGLGAGAAAAPGLASRMALVGGLLHIPAHAFMKLTLFFCAGTVNVETHTDDISNMAGIGRRLPLTMGAFAVAAAGMAGIPLLAGFVSKYFMLIGTVSAGQLAFTAALLVSGVLNVAYFWPVVYTAFFERTGTSDPKPVVEGPRGGRFGPRDHPDAAPGPAPDVPSGVRPDGGADDEGTVDEEHHGADNDHPAEDHGPWQRVAPTGEESTWFMLGPILAAAAGSVVLGLVPDAAVFLRIARAVVSVVTGVGV